MLPLLMELSLEQELLWIADHQWATVTLRVTLVVKLKTVSTATWEHHVTHLFNQASVATATVVNELHWNCLLVAKASAFPISQPFAQPPLQLQPPQLPQHQQQ